MLPNRQNFRRSFKVHPTGITVASPWLRCVGELIVTTTNQEKNDLSLLPPPLLGIPPLVLRNVGEVVHGRTHTILDRRENLTQTRFETSVRPYVHALLEQEESLQDNPDDKTKYHRHHHRHHHHHHSSSIIVRGVSVGQPMCFHAGFSHGTG